MKDLSQVWGVTGVALAWMSAQNVEFYVKIGSMAIPALLASGYTIWKWIRAAQRRKQQRTDFEL